MNTIVDWLLSEGFRLQHMPQLMDGFCRQLVATGVPLWRSTLHIKQLHPLLFGRTFLWHADRGAEEVPRQYGIQDTDYFRRSPIAGVFAGGPGVRRQLEGADAALDFPILVDLKNQGATDYVVKPLAASTPMALTLATRRAGGFTAADLAQVDAALPALVPLVELLQMRRTARALLDTYVGQHAGERILSGEVHRGDGVTIRAVLWYCDIRDFTAISEALPRDALIALLNDFFERTVRPVQENGGEVLKFIGDAVLAIFPTEHDADDRKAAQAALEAAQAAVAGVAEMNEARMSNGQPPIRFGLALHVGDVMYGNIGAQDRLDFTVIGPAVNLVTRMEALCTSFDRPLVVSRAFADCCPSRFTSLGRHQLRGVRNPQEILTLADGLAPPNGSETPA